MAKRSNNSLGRRAYGGKPYDPNNSFVKKMATKVTDLMPQRSWISKWFNSSEDNGEANESPEEGDAEEEIQPPATKRPRIRMDVTHPPGTFSIHGRGGDGTNDNHSGKGPFAHVNQTGDDFPEPPVAGPSGARRFVASTPAVHTDARNQNSQRSELNTMIPSRNNRASNGADDNSESSESTSGCSSLVPQTNRQEAPTNSTYNSNLASRKRIMDEKMSFTNHLQSPRCLFLESGSSRESLSSRRPSFNASIMSNAMDRASSLSSPFYTGNVTFGGSNALSHYKPSRSLFNSTNEFQLKVPRRTSVQVKPSSSECIDSSGMSQTAKRILEAMEYFSSPITDAKKIPVKNTPGSSGSSSSNATGGRKRLRDDEAQGATARVGLRHLTRELSVPTVPEMLKLRRRQKLQDTTMAARKIVSAMSSGGHPATSSSSSSSAAGRAGVANNDEYHLRTEQDDNPKFHGKLRAKMKNKTAEDEAPAPSVNLPRIALPITSLPSFEPLPKYTKPPSVASNRDTSSGSGGGGGGKETFKFASPIKISEAAWNLKSINNFSFSKPLDAEDRKDPNDSREFNSTGKTLSVDSKSSSMFGGNENATAVAANFMWPGSSTAPRLKVKTRPKDRDSGGPTVKESFELKTGSVMDILGAKSASSPAPQQQQKGTSFTSFGAKSSAEIWECVDCYIKNDASEKICVACKASKPSATNAKKSSSAASSTMSSNVASTTRKDSDAGAGCFGSQFKMTSGQWECQSCLVRNQQTEVRCVSCTTPKPSEKSSSSASSAATANTASAAAAAAAAKSSIMDKFKPAEGSWECPGCMLRNPSAVITCPCCKAAKPSTLKVSPDKPSSVKDDKTTSAKPAESSSSSSSSSLMDKFKPATSSWECSSCMVRNNESASSCVCCSNPKPGATAAKSAQPAEQQQQQPPATSSWGDKFKKPEGCWSCDSCLVQNKAEVTECVACGGLKPGASAKPAAKPATAQFSFGIPASSSSGFSFGIDKANEKPKDTTTAASNGGFSFGVKSAAGSSGDSGKFTFGMPKQSGDCSSISSKSPAGSSSDGSAPKATGFVFAAPKTADDGGFKFTGGKRSADDDDAETTRVDEKKAAATFSFGLPKTVDDAAAKGQASKSIFGGPAPAANGKPPQFVFGVPKSETTPEAGKSAATKITFGAVATTDSGGETGQTTDIGDAFAGKSSQVSANEQQQQPPPASTQSSTMFSNPAATPASSASNLAALNRAPFTFSDPKSKPASDSSSVVPCFGQSTASTAAAASTAAFGVPARKIGDAAPAAAAASSLFGIAPSSSTNLASSNQSETPAEAKASPAPSVFGNIEKKPSFFDMAGGDQKASAFGAPEKKQQQQPAPAFGTVENKLTSAFGASDKPINSSMFNSPSPAFGASQSQSLFGNATASPVFGSGSTPSFGTTGGTAAAASTEASGIFAAAKTNAVPTPANPGLFTFGASTAQQQQQAAPAPAAPGAFSFTGGSQPAASAPKSLFAFGGASAAPTGDGFGAPGAGASAGAFGAPGAAAPAPSPFTFNAPPKQDPPPAFGQQQQQQSTGAIPSMFGAQPTAPSIGQPQQAPQPAAGGFNFGGAAAPPASGVFSFGGGMSQPANPPSTGGFNFNAPSASPAIAFDPNSRPSFNFTGGSAPTAFNATPTLQPATTTRKIKKAVRRMPQR